jgi:hypothetical protein
MSLYNFKQLNIMKKKSTFLLLVGAFVAGDAGYWFIGGNYHDYSTVRNLLVALQFILGMAMIWLEVREIKQKKMELLQKNGQ